MTPATGKPVVLLKAPIRTVTHANPLLGKLLESPMSPLMYSLVESVDHVNYVSLGTSLR